MKPLDLLAAVLPPPGHGLYCAAAYSKTRKQHEFVDTIEELKPFVREWLPMKRDIYFALATYDEGVRDAEGNKDRRTAQNATHIKSLFLDIDGYTTNKERGEALFEFLEKTGLDEFGTPHIVASGGGLHCYWPLDRVATILEWKPIAENFKRLCVQEGLNIDKTVTADAARVLRIPGTLNNKKKYGEPRPVKILQEGTAKVDLRRFGATIRAKLTEAYAPVSNNFEVTGLNLEGHRPSKAAAQRTSLNESLMGNSVTRFETIWLKTSKGMGCAQLDYYQNNAQDDGMEPLWRGLLSLAKVCEDADVYTQKISALHPYDAARTRQKLAEIKGPYPCVKFDSENPGICSGCSHWGRITNPLALGREVAVDNAPRQISLPMQVGGEDDTPPKTISADVAEELDDDDAPVAAGTRLFERPVPPKGFDYGRNGGIYRKVEMEDSSGQKSMVQVAVLPYDLYVLDTLRMEEREMHAHLMAIRPIGEANDEGERDLEHVAIILPHKTAVSQDELLKVLANYGVLASYGKANDKYLFDYVRGSLAIATQARRAVDVPIQFGWQKDRSFVYNNRVYNANGSVTPVPMPGLENINRVTAAKGTLEGWRKFWNLMIKREMHTMLALCTDAFGSTLMHFSEYEGFVWHIGSTESGTGKSLTLTAKAGVWGHPIRYRTGKGTSHVAMQQRAGLLNSLPLLIDEITSKTRNDTEWTPEFIFNISEGQGKERMEAGSNKERVNNSTWALTCTMTSNTHMTDTLLGSRKHSSNGEVMRMLEWTPTTKLKFSDEEHKALREVRQNYGVAGDLWVRWLVNHYELARDIWQRVHVMLREKFKFSDEERYWHAACTSTLAAATMMSEQYAGIINLPMRGMAAALLEMVERARENHKRAARNAEDVLNSFTREYYGRFVIIRKDMVSDAKEDMGLDAATRHSTRNAIMGRIEIGVRSGCVDYFIEEQLLRQHCAAMSFGYSDFKHQMKEMARARQADGLNYRVKFDLKKNLLARTDGPELRVNVMHFTAPQRNVDDDGQLSLEKG